ncbi:MAG TPA: HD domain-containing phosphohydrolase [Bryobacteraceae bacterium]|nr:HD domain-containing phosphohydrolase [Bryobacteraceae bacterium]
MHKSLTVSKILIVDDEWPNVHLLDRFLQEAGFTNLRYTTDPTQALGLYKEFQPDLVLLDLLMPFLDGFAVMKQLCEHTESGEYTPILVLTADITSATKQRALSSGAKDFLTKPLDLSEVYLRIRNLLETRLLHLEVRAHNEHLEQKVRERTQELEESKIEVLERLAIAGEYRDYDTGEHTRRVGTIAAALAEALGSADPVVDLIRRAAPLHDIGKIGIPDQILLKAGRLSPAEFEIMKTHTTIGAKILSGSQHALLQIAESVARTHHERWDGSGYPSGLSAEAIPFEGRVVALADTFDALTHPRPYKEAWPAEAAIAEIKRQGGRQFDPAIVSAFVRFTAATDLLPLISGQSVHNLPVESRARH